MERRPRVVTIAAGAARVLVVALALSGCGDARAPSMRDVPRDVPPDASATPPPQPPTAPATSGAILELRLRLDEPPSPAAPRRIVVVPAWAGANRGAARAAGWTSVPLASAAVAGLDLEAGAESVLVARGALPEGVWDRVFVAASAVFERPEAAAAASGSAERSLGGRGPALTDTEDQTSAPIESHIEPIALGFDAAPGATIVAELDLVILDRPSQPGYWRIFVKDARIVPGGTLGANPAFGLHCAGPIRGRHGSGWGFVALGGR